MIQKSIIQVIRSRGLNESDIDAIVAIVGERCRHKTKARLRSILTYGASTSNKACQESGHKLRKIMKSKNYLERIQAWEL